VADTSGLESFSTYLPMADGVRVAIQVLGVTGLRERSSPVVCVFTRYGRATVPAIAAAPFSESLEWTRLGYVVLSVDVRGTGASFGTRGRNQGDHELSDCDAVFDWAAAQPWSNGQLFCTGVSFGGNVADMVQALDHPALVAVAPRFTDFDLYRHLLFPGGMPNVLFARLWGQITAALDRGGDAAEAQAKRATNLVDGDDGTLYDQALAEHADNTDFQSLMGEIVHRDHLQRGNNLAGLAPRIAQVGRPAFHVASWMDAGTAAGALERFAQVGAPMHVRIGGWNHGAIEFADPLGETRPLSADERLADIRDLDIFFREAAAGGARRRLVEYRTLGRPGWRSTPVWPPAGVEGRALWLDAGGRLSPDPGAAGADDLTVDFDVGTGMESRWSTQVGTGVRYPDRRAPDDRLLVYESEPLPADLEIVGSARLDLRLSTDREDGLVIAYLEVVQPGGEVIYLTEGGLRLLHRAARTFAEADASPAIPGQTMEITFDLLPIAALLRAGQRLRLALAGADADAFARIPEEGAATLRITRASRLTLPILR